MAFDSQRKIIEKAEFLSPDILPDKITDRAAQTADLCQCLRSMEKSLWPVSAWLYGPPGTGKTAAARKIAAQFTTSSNRVSLYINCWERPTLYSAAQALCEQLKVLDAEAWDTNIKLSRLKQVLKNRSAVIILDEIDRCTDKERDSIIYQLLGLGKTNLFCISRGSCTFLRLEERVQSKLTPAHIYFPKYSVSELKAILAERAWQALGAGSWTEAVLGKIAALADGDARVALHTLLKAAVAAEQENASKIAVRHVPHDASAWRKAEQISKIKRLTRDQRIIYKLINKCGQVYSAKLRRDYILQCHNISVKPVSRRTFSRYIEKLAEKNFITVETEAIGAAGRLIKKAA